MEKEAATLDSLSIAQAAKNSGPSMLRLMNTPDEIMQDSVIYLRIYFAGIIFVFLYNMGSSILRAVGDSKHPLYYLVACCLLNIILDVLFVVAFHMGVLGVAVATLISQAFSALLVTRKLLRSDGMLKLSFSRIRFHGSVLKNQLKLGLPTGFEAILFAITNIAIQSAVNTFGTDTSAAWSAYGKLDAIFWMVRQCRRAVKRSDAAGRGTGRKTGGFNDQGR